MLQTNHREVFFFGGGRGVGGAIMLFVVYKRQTYQPDKQRDKCQSTVMYCSISDAGAHHHHSHLGGFSNRCSHFTASAEAWPADSCA